MAKLNIIKKHAPILLILSVAFLMVGSVSTQSAFAAVPQTMSAPTVSSFTDLSVTIAFVAPVSDSDITDYEIKKDGVLVPKNNSDTFVNAIDRLIAQPEFAQQLSIAARKKVEQFDWEVVKQKWDAVLQ